MDDLAEHVLHMVELGLAAALGIIMVVRLNPAA
jgi:hypothetical protein